MSYQTNTVTNIDQYKSDKIAHLKAWSARDQKYDLKISYKTQLSKWIVLYANELFKKKIKKISKLICIYLVLHR